MKRSQKKTQQQPIDSGRRDFVKKSTAIGSGVIAAAAIPAQAVAAVSEEPTEKKTQKGYQVTQHVIDYYKSAAV